MVIYFETIFFLDSASDVGCEKNLYTFFAAGDRGDPEQIEKLWSRYETDIPSALEKLIDGTLDAETWVRVLVPFVTGLLVRGPEWKKHFNRRD